MKSSEFLNYLKKTGFGEKIGSINPTRKIKVIFEEPIRIDDYTEILALFSLDCLMQVDCGDGETEQLDWCSEEIQTKIFEEIEQGNWDLS